ncbi:GAP family protein [Nocardioides renjunii]|uniref:GAP family protein n=1 Tax=Nocardioides renjunii TaxID=3095075 RepID=UPI002AFF8ABB|nr:GAP family protein [Nocardioides sp. S-34]WQQ20541.1 GAP family protein [Nocardioides sp. S-34]
MSLILPVLLLGLMASLSPATIVVSVLVLGTARARVNAAAFLTGWVLSLTVVFTASYAVAASGATERGDGRTSVAVLETLLGAGLLWFGARRWSRRATDPPASPDPAGSSRGTQRLVGRMAHLTPLGAATVGVLKQPWALTSAAALVVVRDQVSLVVVAVAFAVFTVASTATVAGMFGYYARRPGEARVRLAMLRDRVVRSGPAVWTAVAVLVGTVLLVDGLLALT